MSAPDTLESNRWYRIADLKLRLQPGTRVQRQVLRSENWFIFSHPASRRRFRANEKAYALIGRFDGRHTLDELWRILQAKLGDAAPTQDEVIAVLTQFLGSGLVQHDSLPDWPKLLQHRRERRRRERAANLNPFAFRMRLLDPMPLLERLPRLDRVMFHPPLILAWILLCGWASLHAALDWYTVHAYAEQHLFNRRGLLLAWLVFPFMKTVHELAHAFAVRHWGGEVRELGIGFFLLTPAPYVDASAATAFPNKWQRIAVSAAGMLAEAGLAALAFLIWAAAEDGVVRETAFIVMAIGGASTFAFNANPLWRYDGYYILCDLIAVPDLGNRSLRWWRHLLQVCMQGGSGDPVRLARGTERIWLILYAPASWLARLLMTGAIVHWVAARSPALGLLALAWLGWQFFAMPAWHILAIIAAPAASGARRQTAMFGAVIAGALLAALFCLLPVPANTFADGVVWLPERANIRSAADARVKTIVAHDGEQVRQGQTLLETVSPVLESERARLRAQILAAETEQVSGWQRLPQKGKDALEKIERLKRDLAVLDRQHASLVLRAETDGRFVLADKASLLDRDLVQGVLVAHVLAGDGGTVRVLVAQDDIGRIREGVRSITARLAEGGPGMAGRIVRIAPAATAELPSLALGDKGGGKLATDPGDLHGRTALQPAFIVDVLLPAYRGGRAGARAVVRFEHEAEPLARLTARRVRQLFLKTFSTEAP